MSIYVPALVAVLLVFLRPRQERLFAAGLVGFAWSLPSVLLLQFLNQRFVWWQFHVEGGLFRGMPLDLFLGWASWGVIPVLAFRKMKVAVIVAIFFAIDLILMPMCHPVVELRPDWLVGEVVALSLVLLPATFLARWTLEAAHLGARAVLQVVAFAGLFLVLLPELVFAVRPGRAWSPLLLAHPWLRNLELQGVALLAVIGLSAVQEFVQHGGGTPIPYDPPKRLVSTGLYRYISNPMQLSCALVMTVWGIVLRNPFVAMAGPMSFLYSLGLAAWDEGEDMNERFGDSWRRYRRNVRAWRPRLTPWHDPDALRPTLYIAETCGPCSGVAQWFKSHRSHALEILAAEDHTSCDLWRITYDPLDGTAPEEGVRAFARGLEHIHVGWAFVGAFLRLPGISHFIQLLLDASGLGPRRIPRRSVPESASIPH